MHLGISLQKTLIFEHIVITKDIRNVKEKLAVIDKFPQLFDVKTLYLQDFSTLANNPNKHALFNDALRTQN